MKNTGNFPYRKDCVMQILHKLTSLFRENSSKYLYEYKTQESKWWNTFCNILTRITAAVFWWGIFQIAITEQPARTLFSWVFMFIMLVVLTIMICKPDLISLFAFIRIMAALFWLPVLLAVPRTLAEQSAHGLFYFAATLALLVVQTIVICKPDLIPLGTIPLIVRISQKELFLRKLLIAGRNITFRKRIPIEQVKSARVNVYTESGFDYLYNSIELYNEKGHLCWHEALWMDGSTRHDGITRRCAVLELVDGKQVFIEFKGAEEFVAALNNLRSSS